MIIKLKIQKIPPGGSHIFVKGKIGRKKVTCLIDTGASKSVIDKTYIQSFFSQHKVRDTDHSTAGLGATYDKSSFVVLPRIKLGDKSLKNIEFGVLDLAGVNAAYTAAGLDAIVVIIGGDILLKNHCILDYGKKIMQIF